jgi:hypothetical protein
MVNGELRMPALLVYLVPLARSRYCASPEASIMRLKAAPTLKNYELIT